MTGLQQDVQSSPKDIWRSTIPVWLALMVLLTATLVLAYVPMGEFNTVCAIGIAVLKALVVALFFMHLKRPDPLLRLTGAATLIWLFFMFSLTFADTLERAPPTQPGTLMPREYGSAPASGERGF